ncbi:MAG: hypothetical protein NTV61_04035 [Candidatus Bathyarchaeota archaeon]|nr:hypothetical protein [Candidatus Bathyarchaeota archaeon]
MNDKNRENELLAILFSNTKRKNRVLDLITLGTYFTELIALYQSRKKVAELIGISEEMVRQFLIPLNMPPEIQDLIKNRSIDDIDTILTLNRIKDKNLMIEITNNIINLNTKTSRDIINLIKEKNIPVTTAKDIILSYQNEKINVVLIDLDEDVYSFLKYLSIEFNVPPASLSKIILVNWLNLYKKYGASDEFF